jgi:uncharacterized protein (DUF302 family)
MGATSPVRGIVQIPSHYSVEETINRLQELLEQKGVKIFARIDQRREAESVGLKLRPTELLIFGSPATGTPVMQDSPTSALDLPLKVAAWQDASGQVWIAYNSPEFFQQRHGLTPDQVKALAAPNPLIDAALK